jgi:phosphate transport system substrate-binding protein
MPHPTRQNLRALGLSPVRSRNLRSSLLARLRSPWSQGSPHAAVGPGVFSPAVVGVILGTILAFGLALGCNPSPKTTERPLCIAGSTSVQPFAEKLAEVYMHHHPRARIDVQGGGSSAGIYAATHGAADLGASSRELIGEEKKLIEIPMAYDGIAVIVHPANPLTTISLSEIRQIFGGAVKNWCALGLPPHDIDLITREEGSGTREAFEHLVMGKQEITPAALVQDSNGSVREIVAGDPYALGYISAGLVDHRVKALAIDGVMPTRENIKTHAYKLVRRFLMVARAQPAGSCQAFVAFVLGPNGQKILESEGLVGVH